MWSNKVPELLVKLPWSSLATQAPDQVPEAVTSEKVLVVDDLTRSFIRLYVLATITNNSTSESLQKRNI